MPQMKIAHQPHVNMRKISDFERVQITAAIVVILAFYNLFYTGQVWLANLWYVCNYGVIASLLHTYYKRNVLLRIAYFVVITRLVYNFGIFIGIVEYDKTNESYFVPFFTLFLLIISKWLR